MTQSNFQRVGAVANCFSGSANTTRGVRMVGPPIFLLARRRERTRKRVVADLFGGTFDDDQFLEAFVDQDAVRICLQVSRFAGGLTGTEVKGILEPQAVHAHRVRPSIRPHGDDNVIVRLGEPLPSPTPIEQSFG